MIRKRCVRKGHDWITFFDAYRPAVQPCSRWFCGARQPDPLLPKTVREALQRSIDQQDAR
jgi:hypothetical protein